MGRAITDPRFFDHDPLTGAVEYYHYDLETKGFFIERRMDVEPIVEVAKALSNDAADNWRADMHHVATLPDVITMKLMKAGILAGPGKVLDQKRFKAWLNDRDNRMWRTKPGVI